MNLINMTDNQLIEKALNLNYIDWAMAGEYAKQADTPETKERLRKIESNLYKKEEYFSNLI